MSALSSELTIDVRYKHRKYGVRCSYCDTKWPCDAMKLAIENDDIRVDLIILRKKYDKLRLERTE